MRPANKRSQHAVAPFGDPALVLVLPDEESSTSLTSTVSVNPSKKQVGETRRKRRVRFKTSRNQAHEPRFCAKEVAEQWFSSRDYKEFTENKESDLKKMAGPSVTVNPFEKSLESTFIACCKAVSSNKASLSSSEHKNLSRWVSAGNTSTRLGLEKFVATQKDRSSTRRSMIKAAEKIYWRGGDNWEDEMAEELQELSKPHRLFSLALGQALETHIADENKNSKIKMKQLLLTKTHSSRTEC